MPPVRLAVLGAGMIGRRHAEHVRAEAGAALAAIVDPAPGAKALAEESGVPWHPDLAAMLRDGRPDGIIVATPNAMHVEHGLAAVAAGIPALVEKPVADTLDGAERLVAAAEAARVPLLVGHHRRHNRLVAAARRVIEAGRLGRLVAAQGTCWFHKPAEYFDVAWRRERGAGPVLVNLIHDVDLLRHFCGEVVQVQAMQSSAVRGYPVEDTAVILLRFANGVLGTLNVSDTVVAPWSWELTAGENPAYPRTEEACCVIGGTLGSLTIPRLDVWYNPTKPSWWEPIGRERLPGGAPEDPAAAAREQPTGAREQQAAAREQQAAAENPLARQIRNFCGVIRGTETPVVSGREGLETLRIVCAIKEAAETGRAVTITAGSRAAPH